MKDNLIGVGSPRSLSLRVARGFRCLALVALACSAMSALAETRWQPIDGGQVEGRLWTDTEQPFDRIPSRVRRTLGSVWGNGVSPTGEYIDFESDTTSVSVQVKLLINHYGESNFNSAAFAGFDLYAKDGNVWRWVSAPSHGTRWTQNLTYTIASRIPKAKRTFRLYFPMRNRIGSLAIGVDQDAQIKLLPKSAQKPVIYYGTSIIHGAYVSRSGMALTCRLGRALDRPVVNLGFSGGARLEPAMAELMAEKDAAVYVCDPFHNLSPALIRANFEKFFDTLCAKRPNTPVVLISAPHIVNEWIFPHIKSEQDEKTRLFNELAPKVAARHPNFHYLRGEGFYGAEEVSVDGIHPNDEANAHMARTLAPILKSMIK